jgi:hypothetical protein
MSKKKTAKEQFNHCFLDLQRAAVSLSLNPSGKTHLIFLKHAQKILKALKTPEAKNYLSQISQIEKQIPFSGKEKKTKYLSDKILTLGILMKK